MRQSIAFQWLFLCFCSTAAAAPGFAVRFEESVRKDPASGRLVVYLIREGSSLAGTDPADGPFWHDPQPLYGIDVRDLKPGNVATLDDSATAFGPKISHLPPGKYRVQAALDMHQLDSSWRRERGNLFSAAIEAEIKPGADEPIAIELTNTVEPKGPPAHARAAVFEMRSKLLSEFHRRDVILRAGIVLPNNFDPNRAYPAVYEVPGFGGNHLDNFGRWNLMSVRQTQLSHDVFYITLDPESPNGHTLFADSDVNGPCGEALVKELIPALEAKYNLIPQTAARLLRGHSSGGWSVLWLALRYPEIFGACWASSPDPVDFRRLELVNIYDDANAYVDRDGHDIPSTRTRGRVTLSIRGENQQEEVLGPENSSGQQWDSWQAVFGSRDASGWPKPLFDAKTGAIDHAEAAQYRRYDIGHLLRTNPEKYGPIFLQRIRLICGDADDYYLNEAVALLQKDVEALKLHDLPEGRHGYIKMLAGLDHSNIFMSPSMRAIENEMLDHLQRHGYVPGKNDD